jgi:riboflavin synthase
VFTGIIEEIGTCIATRSEDTSRCLLFSAQEVLSDLKVNDSIAVNGVCQTVTARSASDFQVTAVAETLKKTTLGSLKEGQKVNLERAVTPATRLGGHIVQGHIDGVARIIDIKPLGGSWEYFLDMPAEFMHYIIAQGSIAIDGVSLTVAEIRGNVIKIAIIPHTHKATIFQYFRTGDLVNIELDAIAKMVGRFMDLRVRNT